MTEGGIRDTMRDRDKRKGDIIKEANVKHLHGACTIF